MNLSYSNLTNHNNNSSSNTQLEIESLFGIAEDVIIYMIRGISAIGALFNLATIILLFKRRFNGKSYDFLRCRCFCNLSVCLLATCFISIFPCRGCNVDYKSITLNMYVIQPPLRMTLIASVICDNLLILNRLVVLYHWRDSIFNTLSKKATLFICYSVAIAVIGLGYFAVTVVKSSDSPTETKGYWKMTPFGETLFFQLYSVLALLVETVIPLTTLIVFNIISLARFRKLMESKRRAQSGQNNKHADEASERYTKLIIGLSFIAILVRSFDTVISIFYRIKIFYQIQFSPVISSILNLLYSLDFLMLSVTHSLDGIFYYVYDSQMRISFRRR